MSNINTPHPLGFLPNVLTIGRIVSIPILVTGIVLLAKDSSAFIARPSVLISLFILAILTDFFDGFLARRWHVVTDFGRMIDPIADKLFVAGALIAFAIATNGAWYVMVPALAIIGRDILVAGAREHAALSGRVMPPTKLAKFKTAAEMGGLLVMLLWLSAQKLLPIDSVIPSFVEYSGIIGLGLIWIAAVLSVYTGSLYLRAAIDKVEAT